MNLRKKAIRVALLKGATDILPLSLAVLPWGVLFGSLAIQRGFSWFEAQLWGVSNMQVMVTLGTRIRRAGLSALMDPAQAVTLHGVYACWIVREPGCV